MHLTLNMSSIVEACHEKLVYPHKLWLTPCSLFHDRLETIKFCKENGELNFCIKKVAKKIRSKIVKVM